MSVEDADLMQKLIEEQQTVTNPHEMWVQTQVALYSAMRENDWERLKALVDWPDDRTYVGDPLPATISTAFADLLFGDDPTITSAYVANQNEKASPIGQETLGDESDAEGPDEDAPPSFDAPEDDKNKNDQDWLDDMIEANDLPSELRRAEEMCSSEGEVWWRVYVDPSQMPHPILEWDSRSHVRPLFRGRKLIAAVFVSDIHREEIPSREVIVYKFIQIQTEGYVRNLLYRGTTVELGTAIPLEARPETANLIPDWNHGLGMLAGRIPNKLGQDRRYGISDFKGVKELLLALNEATTVGNENMRLVAKRRVVVPASSLGEDGRFDAGEDVLIAPEPIDLELGSKSGTANFQVLEYSFDAGALIDYKSDLAGIILTRVGIAQQFVNANSRSATSEGNAASGTALRLRLIPTTMAANGKARFWDDALPKILMLMQLLDAMDPSKGGFGRTWQTPGSAPVVERSQPLPPDENELITQHATAVAAEIESRKTAIMDLHQDWSPDQVEAELQQIEKEIAEFGAPGAKGGLGGQEINQLARSS
jgi:hypothetical protein